MNFINVTVSVSPLIVTVYRIVIVHVLMVYVPNKRATSILHCRS